MADSAAARDSTAEHSQAGEEATTARPFGAVLLLLLGGTVLTVLPLVTLNIGAVSGSLAALLGIGNIGFGVGVLLCGIGAAARPEDAELFAAVGASLAVIAGVTGMLQGIFFGTLPAVAGGAAILAYDGEGDGSTAVADD